MSRILSRSAIAGIRTRLPISFAFPFINQNRTEMSERRSVVNPRASAVAIVRAPKHCAVILEGIIRIKDKVKLLSITFMFNTSIKTLPMLLQVIKAILSGQMDIKNFSQHQHHPPSTEPNAPNWIFLIDTLNFCFWTQGDATKWTVDGETGYFALCAAVARAHRCGIDITNPQYYSKITVEELGAILRSDDEVTQVPLLEDRVKCLREVGNVLLERYDGRFENVLKEADHSARRLLRIVTEFFPCYRDEAEWNGIGVSLYKRAQILIGDLVTRITN